MQLGLWDHFIDGHQKCEKWALDGVSQLIPRNNLDQYFCGAQQHLSAIPITILTILIIPIPTIPIIFIIIPSTIPIIIIIIIVIIIILILIILIIIVISTCAGAKVATRCPEYKASWRR